VLCALIVWSLEGHSLSHNAWLIEFLVPLEGAQRGSWISSCEGRQSRWLDVCGFNLVGSVRVLRCLAMDCYLFLGFLGFFCDKMEKWLTWVAGWEMFGFWSSSRGRLFLTRSGILWRVFSYLLIRLCLLLTKFSFDVLKITNMSNLSHLVIY